MRTKTIQPKKRGANIQLLNPQQRLFVEHLLADKSFNPTAAAKAAGYKNPSGSVQKLLSNKIVNAAIGKALHDRIEKTKVTAEMVIHELAAVAFSNIQEVMGDNDSIKKLSDLPENVARSISSIKVQHKTEFDHGEPVTVVVKEIKFWDKLNALTLLAKHLGMITEKHEFSGEIKHTLDYEKLYFQENKKTITLDPVEYAIENPASDPIPKELSNYVLDELVEGEPDNA